MRLGIQAAAVGTLASSLNSDQLVAALDATEQEMNAEVDQRASQVAAAQAATGALETAALSILSRLVISAL